MRVDIRTRVEASLYSINHLSKIFLKLHMSLEWRELTNHYQQLSIILILIITHFSLSLVCGDLPLVWEVCLVAHQHDDHMMIAATKSQKCVMEVETMITRKKYGKNVPNCAKIWHKLLLSISLDTSQNDDFWTPKWPKNGLKRPQNDPPRTKRTQDEGKRRGAKAEGGYFSEDSILANG